MTDEKRDSNGDEPAARDEAPGGDVAASPAPTDASPDVREEASGTVEAPQEAEEHELPERPEADGSRFLVVGIGASAGGLDALRELLPRVPHRGMAYIVVQHLAPDHASALPQLLARTMELPVMTATDGSTIEPGHVYVIPPGVDLAVLRGRIRLLDPPAARQHLPIDFMLRSLADDLGPSAVGVVLSGTGTDGTFGLQAIKAAGGLTLVQDPETARYDGMPRSALASGAADISLAPAAIGEELARLAGTPRPRARSATPHSQAGEEDLARLFVVIRTEFGNDLTNYKQTTIERRVERRMTLHRIERLADYVRLVQQDRDELRALYKDMLITVTSFFRDPEAFDALKRLVFPKLFERAGRRPVRVWVPACATGEEAYSLAIALTEFCEDQGKQPALQIFGTDVDEASIQHARQGAYSMNIAGDMSPERLNRFFLKKESEYQIARRIRDMLVFSRQNVLKDAPFSRIDLVSCRNLLIYLQPAAQKNVLRVLHYALNPSGYLFLGSSETVGDAPELFGTVDRKHKIYERKQVAATGTFDLTFRARAPEGPPAMPASRAVPNLQSIADRKVLELYGPPGVVISPELEILQFRGHTGPYLDPAPGAASLNILRIARFELHIELKRAIQQAKTEQRRITAEVGYTEDDRRKSVEIDVVPLHDAETAARPLLVLFHPRPTPDEIPLITPGASPDQAVESLAQRSKELERELEVTKEYLQTALEEKESMLEELKSANEELQSSNEELQSTNEELETSKEEMQSTNEELTTVNDELQSRMSELSQTNDDLHNILAGVDNVVVIVGMDLRIRRYTSAAERLFNLVPGDIGRSINFLAPFLSGTRIEVEIANVIQSLTTFEEEVQVGSRWYALRITPYKTLDHAIRGALVTLADVDIRKRALATSRDVGDYAERFLAAIGHPLLIVDRRHRVVWCNDQFLTVFQLTRDEVVGSVLGGRLLDNRALRARLDDVFETAIVLRDFAVTIRIGETQRALSVSCSQVPASGETPLALLSFEPVTPKEPS